MNGLRWRGGVRESSGQHWQPKEFQRFDESIASSMCTARVTTDVGPAYLKALGNPQGPHQLACDYVGTQLAEWFGLPTLDYALLIIDAAIDEIPLKNGKLAESGPALASKAADGHPWGGSEEELDALVNPEDIARLVVFDTWTLNCDRHPADLTKRRPNYDNVFLEKVGERGKDVYRLLAIDHGCCFSGGRDLSPKIAGIGRVQDNRLYGMFPGFVQRVREDYARSAIARLGDLGEDTAREIVQSVPEEWEVSLPTQNALTDLICRRAGFVASNIMPLLQRACWPDHLFDIRA
jgi:hypothetical protein